MNSFRRLIRSAANASVTGGFYLRKKTASARVLPNTFLIGVSKGGTTSLALTLWTHPGVMSSYRKETYYFCRRRVEQGVDDFYRAFFPTKFHMKVAQRRLKYAPIITDCTSSNYYCPHAPAQIHAICPDAKLLMVMRNPIDRAFSQYKHVVKAGHESAESFERALEADREATAGEYDRMLADPNYLSEPMFFGGYLERGYYSRYLKRWFDIFPSEQIQLHTFERMIAKPDETLEMVLDFLELPQRKMPLQHEDPAAWLDTVGADLRTRDPEKRIRPETRAELQEHFRPWNKELREFLPEDPGWD